MLAAQADAQLNSDDVDNALESMARQLCSDHFTEKCCLQQTISCEQFWKPWPSCKIRVDNIYKFCLVCGDGVYNLSLCEIPGAILYFSFYLGIVWAKIKFNKIM